MDDKEVQKFQKKVNKLVQQLEKKGWNAKLGFKLAELYFDMGELDKAEEQYFKYLDQTGNDDAPMWIYMKWLAQKGNRLEIGVGGPKGLGGPLLSSSPEQMMKMYEMGREGYLKRHNKIQ